MPGEPQFGPTGGANPNLANYLANRIDGKSMRALKIERESLIASLEATQTAKPATILNFNPVPLRVDGGLVSQVPKVPSILDDYVKDEDRITFNWQGRKYRATVMTIRYPLIFPWIKDVKKSEQDDDLAVGVYDMRACKQIEIAHCFLVAYTSGTPVSSGMGGVVVFEGDRHTLTNAPRDDKNRRKIRIPTYKTLPNRTREYFCEDAIFEEICGKALADQKLYAAQQTQSAQNYWDQEDQRANITPIHRVWHQYEMDMGYRHTQAPWVTLQNEPTETCEGCGNPKKRATAYFCHNCQRPYDPLKAYMAGELPIDSPHMARVASEKDWEKIRAEEKRRRELREGKSQPSKE